MTFKKWMQDKFSKDELSDIARDVSGGFSGLTFYRETVPLHDKHEKEIWEALEEERQEMGAKSIMEHIASFSGAKDVGSMEQFKNLLVWWMAERTARELTGE